MCVSSENISCIMPFINSLGGKENVASVFAMQTFGGVEAWLHLFLASCLWQQIGQDQASCPVLITRVTWTRNLVKPQSRDLTLWRQISYPCRESSHDSLDSQSMTQLLQRSCYPVSYISWFVSQMGLQEILSFCSLSSYVKHPVLHIPHLIPKRFFFQLIPAFFQTRLCHRVQNIVPPVPAVCGVSTIKASHNISEWSLLIISFLL